MIGGESCFFFFFFLRVSNIPREPGVVLFIEVANSLKYKCQRADRWGEESDDDSTKKEEGESAVDCISS